MNHFLAHKSSTLSNLLHYVLREFRIVLSPLRIVKSPDSDRIAVVQKLIIKDTQTQDIQERHKKINLN
jgi:hypothetical protein